MQRIHGNFSSLTVRPDAPVADAVKRLGQDIMQTAFVVDDEGILLGIVTNGDFRRFMLAGGTMTQPVSACMNTRFTRVGLDATHGDLAQCFSRGAGAIPRVDGAGRLIEVVTHEYRAFEHDTHHKILWDRANQQSADYIEPHLDEVLLFNDRPDMHDFVVSRVRTDGLWAEFGVFGGASINHFAHARPGQRIYGFDSFEGLKEEWAGLDMGAGHFHMDGQLPPVRANVTLVKGWFDQTLPDFLAEHPEPAAFLHMDADTYPSTALVLDLMGERIRAGTVILFDEYLGYPNWRNGERKAWFEFTQRTGLPYRYLAFGVFQAAVLVL